jgi:hypothetical protein
LWLKGAIMHTHPYLRAFLAGIFVPSLILPLFLLAFILLRLVAGAPFPIERGIVFPMGLVPVLWGLWNMLHLCSRDLTHLSIGVHGALLPFFLLPAGTAAGTCLGVLRLGSTGATWFAAVSVPYGLIAVCFALALAAYYLVWKYIVGFLNRLLEIA